MVAFTSLAIAIFLLIILTTYTRRLLTWARNRARLVRLIDEIPGPPALPLIGCMHRFSLDRMKFSHQLEADVNEYGKEGILRYWLGTSPMVAVGSPETAEVVLTSQTAIDKSNNYDVLIPWLGTGLLISGGSKWRRRRKMLTPTFHFNILNSFFPVFDEQARVLVDCLAGEAGGRTFDIFPYIKRCALDIICETAMGTSVHAQMDRESSYVQAVADITEVTFKYNRMPWLWIKPIYYALGYGYTFDSCLKLLTDFTRKVIEQRQADLSSESRRRGISLSQLRSDGNEEEGKQRMAFLDLLICMSDENKLSQEDIREEVDTFMFEGHDTTSSGISFALHFVSNYPDVQRQIHEELDDVFQGSDRPMEMEDLSNLKYLERVVKESLRIVSPVPMFARCLKEDLHVGKYTIPVGSVVTIAPMMVHQNKEHWGPEPFVFDPDNFLPERVAARHPYAYVPFSAGPRNCIGQKFAMNEEKVVLANLFRNYRVEATLPAYSDEVRPLPEIISRPINGFPVKIYKRTMSHTH